MSYLFEYPEHAKSLYLALQEDAFYTTLENSQPVDLAREAMLRYMDYSMHEGEKYGELILSDKSAYGASVWSKPLSSELNNQKSREKEQFLKEHLGKQGLDTYHAIVDFMSEKTDALFECNIWYLSILGLHPDFQGRGLGAGLIESILEKADNEGMATYLETFSPRNITFYERLGYEMAESFYEPTAKAEYWIMVRGSVTD